MKPVDISGLNAVGARLIATAATPARGSETVRPVRLDSAEPRAADTFSARTAGDPAPVDAGRVKAIRKAIENGSYPVIPTRIADAMIAAGYLLRVK